MRLIITDRVACYDREPAKSAKSIKMSFEIMWARVGQMNHISDEDPDPPDAKGQF